MAPKPAPAAHLRPLFRRFLLSVHPDLFSDAPVACKQNEESLQIVLPFFNSIFSALDTKTSPHEHKGSSTSPVVVFHVKRAPEGAGQGGGADGGGGGGTSAVRFTLHGHTISAKISSVTKL